MIKQLADNLILTIDENITPEDIINFFVIIGTNYIKEGTGDAETTTSYNTYLHLHNGLGIGDYQDNVRIAINARTGSITATSFIGKATSAGTADTAANATK